ncbi:ABC transporter ATP-binding protein [Oenococcus sp. UCMA 17063]|nr:ABC transporter ATP-binding protein [Oenococcus sp. UCMA 17063]
MLIVRNLSKSYGKKKVLENLTTSFDEKGISVIVGANGSGKTTFLNTITSLTKADQGEVKIGDLFLESLDFKKHIFYVPSDFFLPEYMTGSEYGSFIMKRYPNGDYEMFKFLFNTLGLSDINGKLIESYSFGMKKKISIAAGLSVQSKYLLADEPFSGLDFESTLLVQNIFEIFGKKRKLVVISHEPSTLTRFPNDIRLMRGGTLIPFTGSPNELTHIIEKEGPLHEKLDRVQKYFDPS